MYKHLLTLSSHHQIPLTDGVYEEIKDTRHPRPCVPVDLTSTTVYALVQLPTTPSDGVVYASVQMPSKPSDSEYYATVSFHRGPNDSDAPCAVTPERDDSCDYATVK